VTSPDPIAGALEAHEWDEALALVDEAGSAGWTPQLLEQRALAAYGAGDFEGTIGAWEEQHRLLIGLGDPAGAGRAAAMVAMFLMIDTGLMAPVRGWLRRAEALLDGPPEPGHALVAAVRTYERFMCGDPVEARRQAQLAIELGQEFDNPAAVVIGRTATARTTILEGRVDEGLAELEEVGALLMGGAVDPLTTGMMLCELVCAAQGLARHDVAVEWTSAMETWSGTGAAFGGLHGRCRVHRAEILRVTGPADAAEAEALGACDDLRPWMRREFGWPLAELGTIRLRMGDLEGAREAFIAAHEHVWCPHPGLALVELARGDDRTAMTLIRDAIDHPFRTPSKERPPFGDLALAPLLEAQVEIAESLGDIETARAATTRLEAVADTYSSPWLAASASLARARLALLDGDPDLAAQHAEAAVGAWAQIGAPFETAVARSTLAAAHARAGRDAAARIERDAAIHGFERYGAIGRAQALREHDLQPTVADRSPHRATFRLDGEIRSITFAGTSASLRDLKGFRYLARLLAEPEREFHVLDLVAVEQGTLPTAGAAVVGPAELEDDARTGIPTLDGQARSAYRRRLEEIDADIEDARRCNDLGRAELAEHDRDFLIAELSRAVGLGGRLRSVGSDVERARTAVTRALRYSVERLGAELPDLGAHLETALRTGTYCSYRPDPMAPITWSC
jgi:tetratricopeptide (TPR) repeat protein